MFTHSSSTQFPSDSSPPLYPVNSVSFKMTHQLQFVLLRCSEAWDHSDLPGPSHTLKENSFSLPLKPSTIHSSSLRGGSSWVPPTPCQRKCCYVFIYCVFMHVCLRLNFWVPYVHAWVHAFTHIYHTYIPCIYTHIKTKMMWKMTLVLPGLTACC